MLQNTPAPPTWDVRMCSTVIDDCSTEIRNSDATHFGSRSIPFISIWVFHENGNKQDVLCVRASVIGNLGFQDGEFFRGLWPERVLRQAGELVVDALVLVLLFDFCPDLLSPECLVSSCWVDSKRPSPKDPKTPGVQTAKS